MRPVGRPPRLGLRLRTALSGVSAPTAVVLDGVISSKVPDSPRLHDEEAVRRVVQRPTGMQVTWHASSSGTFELRRPPASTDAHDTLQ
jgi:hypothetical protein